MFIIKPRIKKEEIQLTRKGRPVNLIEDVNPEKETATSIV